MGNGINCTCGSGAHPRKCVKHPFNYEVQITEMRLEHAISHDEENAEHLISNYRIALWKKFKHETQIKTET